ncbi:MAG: hypothetical protein M9949_14285 [Candidatus Kapabacteria bacterium]|nr:hypothetical protein [Candidatus Kapabacteria bacterium]
MNRAIEILMNEKRKCKLCLDRDPSPIFEGVLKTTIADIESALETLGREQNGERAFTNFYVGGDCNTFGDEYSSYDEAFNNRNAFSNNYKETVEIIRQKK